MSGPGVAVQPVEIRDPSRPERIQVEVSNQLEQVGLLSHHDGLVPVQEKLRRLQKPSLGATRARRDPNNRVTLAISCEGRAPLPWSSKPATPWRLPVTTLRSPSKPPLGSVIAGLLVGLMSAPWVLVGNGALLLLVGSSVFLRRSGEGVTSL